VLLLSNNINTLRYAATLITVYQGIDIYKKLLSADRSNTPISPRQTVYCFLASISLVTSAVSALYAEQLYYGVASILGPNMVVEKFTFGQLAILSIMKAIERCSNFEISRVFSSRANVVDHA
jgi:hypothetical protein